MKISVITNVKIKHVPMTSTCKLMSRQSEHLSTETSLAVNSSPSTSVIHTSHLLILFSKYSSSTLISDYSHNSVAHHCFYTVSHYRQVKTHIFVFHRVVLRNPSQIEGVTSGGRRGSRYVLLFICTDFYNSHQNIFA